MFQQFFLVVVYKKRPSFNHVLYLLKANVILQGKKRKINKMILGEKAVQTERKKEKSQIGVHKKSQYIDIIG